MSRHHPDRRAFLALGAGALAVAATPRLFRREGLLVRRRIPVMGTVAEIAVRHPNEAWAQRSMDLAFDELRRVDRTMSHFRDDSDVGRVNGAAGGAVVVSEGTAEVLAAALAWSAASGGRFDPCLGRLVEEESGQARAAMDGTRNRHAARAAMDGAPTVAGSDPAMATPAGDAPAGFAQALELDRTGSVPRVRLHDPGAAVDLGGIAKGYAVDLAARVLRDRGIFHALVNAGGDLVALGTDGQGEPWTVGVRSPDGSGRVVEVLRVTDAAVATSGTYLQGAHLLDPRSAAPVRTSTRSLTVEAATCMDADAAATALFGAPAEERRRILHAAAPGARIAHTL